MNSPMELTTEINNFVVPGDEIGKILDLKLRIGPGLQVAISPILHWYTNFLILLQQIRDIITATKAGFLRYSQDHKFYWIDNNQKRVSSQF